MTSGSAPERSPDLRREASYPRPPIAVWRALTDRRALTEWLMPNDFEPVIGHRFRFLVDPMPGFSGVSECRVLELEPPRRMVWSWVVVPRDPAKPHPAPMTISWTLVPDGDGTRLVLEQAGLSTLNPWHRFSMRVGWRRMLSKLLPKVLANVDPDGTFTPGAIPLEKRDYPAKTVPPEFLVGR